MLRDGAAVTAKEERIAEVLLVDDDDGIALAGALRLRAAGFAVRMAHDGAGALAQIRASVPDVLVLDLRMPRMDGFEVLSELQRTDMASTLPVIVLTANVAEQARSRALALGARLFLEKPYSGKRLIEAVHLALAGDFDEKKRSLA